MIVYSAIYNGYDNLLEQPDWDGVRYVCYTDDESLTSDQWEIRYEPLRYSHGRLNSFWWKCHPPFDEPCLWLDGSIQLRQQLFLREILELLADADLCAIPHIERDCIYDEAIFSMWADKYTALDLGRQIDHYRRSGWPPHAGLWQVGILGWAATTKARQLGAAWFAHAELFTHQTQVSLPPLIDDYDATIADIPGGFWNNPNFRYVHHLRDD